MPKFKFLRNLEKQNTQQEGKIATAINNLKQALLNEEFNQKILEKEAQRCSLNQEELMNRVLEEIKKENGGTLPEYLQKYENLEAA